MYAYWHEISIYCQSIQVTIFHWFNSIKSMNIEGYVICIPNIFVTFITFCAANFPF